MGVVNVTPDSFSDGGQFDDAAQAVAHGRRLAAEGAAILDVGGESTRPGADPVPAGDEIARVVPVVEGLRDVAQVSIDTMKLSVAQAAVDAGATYVNDVTAFRHDPDLAGFVADRGLDCCLMHMLGEPRTMQRDPRYVDVVSEVKAFLTERMEAAIAAGVPEAKIQLDPGIGFGKTMEHNLTLLARLDEFTDLGRPAGDRHLAQVVHRAAHGPGRDRARARHRRHVRDRARARRAACSACTTWPRSQTR